MSKELIFPGQDNYYVTMQLTPDIHNYVNVVAAVVKDDSNEVYKVTRTMEYSSSFNGLRDRMFAGLIAIYNHVFNELTKIDVREQGELKNFFCVCVETNNDLSKKVISFDAYFIQADSGDDLINSEEFKSIPNVDDQSHYTAIFNFGFQYIDDLNKIGIVNNKCSINCLKINKDGLKRYRLPEDGKFDKDSQSDRLFINSLFDYTNLADYAIGLTSFTKEN